MPKPGRSVDDLPLAAYSTGVDPDTEPVMDEPIAAAVQPAAAAATHLEPTRLAAPVGEAGDPASNPDRAPFREVLRNPRGNVRDPRLLLSGVIAIGVVLLAVSVLASGGPGGTAAAGATPAPSGPAVTAAPPGSASIELTGGVTGTFDLTGLTGTGRAAGTSMDSSWGDAAGSLLALSGPVSAGTRTTDAGFVLSWTVTVNGKPVSFTSKAGECTVGMAVKPETISGSFTCHKVKSADGKLVVGATGTYRT